MAALGTLLPRRSLLVTAQDGPLDAPLWLVLHERHGTLSSAVSLAERCLPPEALRVAVRSARTQTRGSIAPPLGNFWFIGPSDKPELTTLADGLYQLDLLAEDLRAAYGHRQINLLGEGEGATMALLFGLMRADITARIWLENADLPEDLTRIPLDLRPPHQPELRLKDRDDIRKARNIAKLARFGVEL